MESLTIKTITKYPDINKVLAQLRQGIIDVFGENLVGLYLTGSLSYGDFTPGRSDIDLAAILRRPASKKELELIKQLHRRVEVENKKWSKKIECSYIPAQMLKKVLPPKTPRPYIGEGIFYPKAPYGNEWIINLYWLVKCGIPLFGPNFKTLVGHVPIKEVQKASIRDLFKEWQTKIDKPKYFTNSHYQSYIVLNLCRILYTILTNNLASKKISVVWVKSRFPQYANLIRTADSWRHGGKMKRRQETIEFIKFVVDNANEVKI